MYGREVSVVRQTGVQALRSPGGSGSRCLCTSRQHGSHKVIELFVRFQHDALKLGSGFSCKESFDQRSMLHHVRSKGDMSHITLSESLCELNMTAALHPSKDIL